MCPITILRTIVAFVFRINRILGSMMIVVGQGNGASKDPMSELPESLGSLLTVPIGIVSLPYVALVSSVTGFAGWTELVSSGLSGTLGTRPLTVPIGTRLLMALPLVAVVFIAGTGLTGS